MRDLAEIEIDTVTGGNSDLKPYSDPNIVPFYNPDIGLGAAAGGGLSYQDALSQYVLAETEVTMKFVDWVKSLFN